MIGRALSFALAALLAAGSGKVKGDAPGSWSLLLDFNFITESYAISESDRAKPRRVADYMERNPRLQVGLDGLNLGRVSSVRDALVGAGVNASRIRSGAFAEPRLRGERRVLVMVGP